MNHSLKIGSEVTVLKNHVIAGSGGVIEKREVLTTIKDICSVDMFWVNRVMVPICPEILLKIDGVNILKGDVIEVSIKDLYYLNRPFLGQTYNSRNGIVITVVN